MRAALRPAVAIVLLVSAVAAVVGHAPAPPQVADDVIAPVTDDGAGAAPVDLALPPAPPVHVTRAPVAAPPPAHASVVVPARRVLTDAPKTSPPQAA